MQEHEKPKLLPFSDLNDTLEKRRNVKIKICSGNDVVMQISMLELELIIAANRHDQSALELYRTLCTFFPALANPEVMRP